MLQIGTVKKFNLSVRAFLIVLVIFITLIASTITVIIVQTKAVSIKDGENTINTKTLRSTVAEVLKEQDLTMRDGDEIQPPLNAKLAKNQQISITRAVPVSILADGKEVRLNTVPKTVKDVLAQANITLNDQDIVSTQLDDQISADMKIVITRVSQDTVTVTDAIPYNTVSRPNEDMDQGQERIVKEGTEGVSEKKYALVMHDGQEVSRELVSDTVVTPPVDQIREYGTIAVKKTSRGEVVRYRKVLDMQATAYDLSYQSCGKNPGDAGYGRAATGMLVKKGVVAVDPHVIPLRSRLYIEGANGSWIYGYAVAGDTGGLVKGNIIDLFFDSSADAVNFGRRAAKVYILY